MIAILSSILSGMLAGEVLYRFVNDVNLMKLNFILILIVGLTCCLLVSEVLFTIMSLIAGISMIVYIAVRDIK